MTGDSSVRASYRSLRTSQKPPDGVSLYSVHVNRPLGRWLAAAADVGGLSPNQLTLLSGLCSLVPIVALMTLDPSVGLGLLAGLGLVLAFALDSADGQLARVRRSGSVAGEWLDHMIDCAVKLGLHAAVLVAWLRQDRDEALLAVPLVFQFAAVMLFFGGTLTGKLLRAAEPAPRPAARTRLPRVLLLAVDHGTVSCSLLFWGWPDVFVPLYGVLALAHVLFAAGFAVKWFRSLSEVTA